MTRFRKILCPVDFFPGSLYAFDYALKLAKHYGASVTAMHVVEPIIPSVYEPAFSVPDLTTALEKESKRLLNELGVKAATAGVPLNAEVRRGDINTEIRLAVEKAKADLVVVGTHGSKGFERWLVGSVTEKLMRHCSVPLLVIGDHKTGSVAPPEIGSILVTTDFSDATADALSHAFSFAGECHARIDLLHVIDEVAMLEMPSEIRESVIDGVRKNLDRLVPARARARCETNTTVATGTPYQVILKTAKKDKVGLIVMNTHGKGMLERVLVGSTAERVVRGAECPVLLIPPQSSAKTAVGPRKRNAA